MLEGTGVDKGLPQEVINKIINSPGSNKQDH